MITFTVQYLGTRPKNVTPKEVRERLREAFQRLPISMVLLDWDLPPALEEAVAEETRAHSAKLYRWQTWLTGDSHTDLPSEWAVIGLNGRPISGYANDPDFTFICPNRASVEEFLAERLDAIVSRGLFQGIFLDRIRFPSPAAKPEVNLGCFCRHCMHLAADQGFDLEAARLHILKKVKEKKGSASFCRSLFGQLENMNDPFERLLKFRQDSISRVVESAQRQAKASAVEVGLDCFSPILTAMVGQDLHALGRHADWVKIMTYPRVFGPAGISFELLDLLDWLTNHGHSEIQALHLIQESSGLPLPPNRIELRQSGLDSKTVDLEIRRGRAQGLKNLFAGIALVEVKNVHESTTEQIRADLAASQRSDGLVLSWDLWQIPLEYLDMIRRQWEIR